LAFKACGALLQQEQQGRLQQNQLTMLMSAMEIPLLEPLPQPPSLTYTAPLACSFTEHAAAAALCFIDSDNIHLEPELMSLLRSSLGVVPHASHFVSKRSAAVDNVGLSDVFAASGGVSKADGDEAAAHQAHKHEGNGLANGSPQPNPKFETAQGGHTKAASSLLAKKHVDVARRLQTTLASRRQAIVMTNGLSWGERVALQQFHNEKLLNIPFSASVVHSGRVLACFYIDGSLCTVDCLGWIKWYLFFPCCLLRCPLVTMFSSGTAQKVSGSYLCAGCSKPPLAPPLPGKH
jgi:hypothetical protein